MSVGTAATDAVRPSPPRVPRDGGGGRHRAAARRLRRARVGQLARGTRPTASCSTPTIVVGVGRWSIDMSLHEWINDAAMTLFFLVVGLEIKRELVHGELRDVRAAAVPLIGAAGGMLVPALIYLAINAGHAGVARLGRPGRDRHRLRRRCARRCSGRRAPRWSQAAAAHAGGGRRRRRHRRHRRRLRRRRPTPVPRAGGRRRWPHAVLGPALPRALARPAARRSSHGWRPHASGVHATIAGVALAMLTPASAGAAGRRHRASGPTSSTATRRRTS